MFVFLRALVDCTGLGHYVVFATGPVSRLIFWAHRLSLLIFLVTESEQFAVMYVTYWQTVYIWILF